MANAHFYLIDTNSLWNVHAHLPENEATDAMRNGGNMDELTVQAGALLEAASTKSATMKDSIAQLAMGANVKYLSVTDTYRQALEKSNKRHIGHWLVLCYHYRNGGKCLRPGYLLGSNLEDSLPPHDFMKAVLTLIRSDLTGNPASKIGRHIVSNGGLKLHPQLSAKVMH